MTGFSMTCPTHSRSFGPTLSLPLLPKVCTMIPSFLSHLDWEKIAEGVLTSAGGGYGLLLLGRRTQAWREKVDTRTADQKNIDQLLGRVGTLETQMTAANAKIEDLRTEKMNLQIQVVTLREQIALLEVQKATFESEKAGFESREALFSTQIASLQLLLADKSSQLLCAEAKLRDMEENRQQEENRQRLAASST